MEAIDESNNSRNNELNLSYCEGVKRVVHNSCDIGDFTLPNGVIENRKTAWNRLFSKYNYESADDYEIDMLTSDIELHIDDDDVDKHSKDDNQEEKEEEGNNYFVKNRTPIRKVPALMQYWVDTGNPPFQLNVENDESESSLSEERKSSPLLIHRSSDTEGKRDNSTSFPSSVDTAAYILSNTNVTTKADTLAIVEGAKKSDDCGNNSKDGTADCDNNNQTTNARLRNMKIVNEISKNFSCFRAKLKVDNNLDNSRQNGCDNSEKMMIMQSSMKITDILPTLEQLDKTMNECQNGKDDLSDIISAKNNQLVRKSLVRKKLYTGRNSPIDLIVSNLQYDNKFKLSSNSHPALQNTPSVNGSRAYFKRRSKWVARKRKRRPLASKLEEITESTQTSVDKDVEEKGKNKLKLNSEAFDAEKLKHSSQSETLSNEKQNLIELCMKKILVIRLVRISDQILNKSITSDELSNKNDEIDQNKGVVVNTALSDSTEIASIVTCSDEQPINRTFLKIDLDSQESDQSTILICKCVDGSAPVQQGRASNNDLLKTEIIPIKSRNEVIEIQSKLIETDQAVSCNVSNKTIGEQYAEDFSDEDSDVFVGKINRISSMPSRFTLLSSSFNKGKSYDESEVKNIVINSQTLNESQSNEKSEQFSKHSSRPEITFSSDEEDDFTKMISKRKADKSSSNESTSIIDTQNKQVIISLEQEVTRPWLISSSDEEEVVELPPPSPKRKRSRRIQVRNIRSTPKPQRPQTSQDENTQKCRQRNTQTSKLKQKLIFTKSSSEEEISSPPKKLKSVIPCIDIDNHNDNGNQLNHSTINESIALLNGNYVLNKSKRPITPVSIQKSSRTLRLLDKVSASEDCKSIDTIDKAVNNKINIKNQQKSFNKVNIKNRGKSIDSKIPSVNNKSIINNQQKPINKINIKNQDKSIDTEIQLINQKRSIKNQYKSINKQVNSKIQEETRNYNINIINQHTGSLKKRFTSKKYSLTKKCNTSLEAVDPGLSSPARSSAIDKQSDIDNPGQFESIIPINDQDSKRTNSSKRHSQRRSTRLTARTKKQTAQKNSSILTSDDSNSENDVKFTTRRKSTRKVAELSAENHTIRNFDTIFPDPVNHLCDDSTFLNKTISELKIKTNTNRLNGERSRNYQSSSNCTTRSRIKFSTMIDSDSD